MRTTITIDDELLERATQLTGINERAALVRHALKALIAREAARELARMGGSDPNATAAPRRRFD
jgi:Arc/MetJ family transcription regulator